MVIRIRPINTHFTLYTIWLVLQNLKNGGKGNLQSSRKEISISEKIMKLPQGPERNPNFITPV